MRGKWLGSLATVLSVWLTATRAEEPQWRPAATTRPIVVAATPNAGAPGVSLGKPTARTGPSPVSEPQFRSVGHESPSSPIIRAQGFDGGPPPVPPPGVPSVPGGPVGPIGPGGVPPVPTGPAGPTPPDPLCGPGCIDPYGGVGAPGAPGPGGLWNNNQFQQYLGWTGDWNRTLFQSDHCFDNFASPVSNPFWTVDPRALTEIKPIFIYQKASDKTQLFGGMSTQYFGTSLSLALTDNLSIIMPKLGGIWIQPGTPPNPNIPELPNASSFAELSVGPKFTFLRMKETQSVAAIGVTFDIPTGSAKAFQDTQSLTIRPYLSYAQAFGRSSFGTFNTMATVGYNFGLDDRSDNFFTNLHLDYNIGNLNRVYPLIEVNWTHYTGNGNILPLGLEGRDLFNLGSTSVSGRNDVSLATGLRYKIREWAQVGAAAEFPLSGNGDLSQFRFTFDFILRY